MGRGTGIWFLVIVWLCRTCLGRDGQVTHVFWQWLVNGLASPSLVTCCWFIAGSQVRRLVRWEKPTQRRKSIDPLGSRPQGDHLAPSSTSVPDVSDRSSFQEGPRPQFSRKQCTGARDDGQLSTGSWGVGGACSRDRAAIEFDECCGGR